MIKNSNIRTIKNFLKSFTKLNIFWVLYKLFSRIQDVLLPMYAVHGKAKNGASDISLFFLGKMDALAYLSEVIFANDFKQENAGSSFIWNVSKSLARSAMETDFTVVKTDRFFSDFLRKKGFIIIPEWIEMSMTLPEGLPNLSNGMSSSAKKDLQTLQKYGYSYEISRDIEKLDFFYYSMCLPYMRKRHGKLAHLEFADYTDVMRNFKRGFLLFVKEQDKYIGGSMIIIKNKVAYPIYMGVVDEEMYLTRGVGAALYYFPLLWAEKNGVKKINFGNTRTFLNSGDFQYKRKWGMTASRSNIFFGIYGLRIHQPSTTKVVEVLEHHPFLYEENGALKGFVITRQPLSVEILESLWKQFFTPGVSALSIFSPFPISEAVREHVQSTYDGKILLIDSLNTIT